MQRIDKVLRRLILDQIEDVACVAEDCGRLVGDAACRIDVATLAARLIQLRLCVIAMIESYNELQKILTEKRDGSGVAEGDGSSHANRADQRPGDGVA